jgi:hypothetical protein
MTWWIEALGWWRGGTQTAASRIADGPPAETDYQSAAADSSIA